MSLPGCLFGKSQPTKKKKTTTTKKSRSTSSAQPSKSKARKSTSTHTGTQCVIGEHPTVRYTVPASATPDQMLAQSRSARHAPGRSVRVAGRVIPVEMVSTEVNFQSRGGRSRAHRSQTGCRAHGCRYQRNLSFLPAHPLGAASRIARLSRLAGRRPAGWRSNRPCLPLLLWNRAAGHFRRPA